MKIGCFKILLLGVLFLGLEVYGQDRMKQILDQRLVELEALIALSKMQEAVVTVPEAVGKLNPDLLGRRKHSQKAMLLNCILNRLEEDPEDEFKE